MFRSKSSRETMRQMAKRTEKEGRLFRSRDFYKTVFTSKERDIGRLKTR